MKYILLLLGLGIALFSVNMVEAKPRKTWSDGYRSIYEMSVDSRPFELCDGPVNKRGSVISGGTPAPGSMVTDHPFYDVYPEFGYESDNQTWSPTAAKVGQLYNLLPGNVCSFPHRDASYTDTPTAASTRAYGEFSDVEQDEEYYCLGCPVLPCFYYSDYTPSDIIGGHSHLDSRQAESCAQKTADLVPADNPTYHSDAEKPCDECDSAGYPNYCSQTLVLDIPANHECELGGHVIDYFRKESLAISYHQTGGGCTYTYSDLIAAECAPETFSASCDQPGTFEISVSGDAALYLNMCCRDTTDPNHSGLCTNIPTESCDVSIPANYTGDRPPPVSEKRIPAVRTIDFDSDYADYISNYRIDIEELYDLKTLAEDVRYSQIPVFWPTTEREPVSSGIWEGFWKHLFVRNADIAEVNPADPVACRIRGKVRNFGQIHGGKEGNNWHPPALTVKTVDGGSPGNSANCQTGETVQHPKDANGDLQLFYADGCNASQIDFSCAFQRGSGSSIEFETQDDAAVDFEICCCADSNSTECCDNIDRKVILVD